MDTKNHPLSITLHAVKNVDIPGGWWDSATPPRPARKAVPVADFLEARTVFEEWRDSHGLGGGNLGADCGDITDVATGKVVASISYNGRVWTPEEFPKAKEVPPETLAGRTEAGGGTAATGKKAHIEQGERQR